MKIAILGTGGVGQTLAAKLSDLGHTVVIGTRNPRESLARTDPDAMGNPGFGTWAQAHSRVSVLTFAQAGAGADLLVNATSGGQSLAVLTAVGAQHLAGKILMDIANPLDFSRGFPPFLSVSNTDSLGEQIQKVVAG